jgi:hypothetical protein
VKKELKLQRSLYEILQILSLTLFEKSPIFQMLSDEKRHVSDPATPKAIACRIIGSIIALHS